MHETEVRDPGRSIPRGNSGIGMIGRHGNAVGLIKGLNTLSAYDNIISLLLVAVLTFSCDVTRWPLSRASPEIFPEQAHKMFVDQITGIFFFQIDKNRLNQKTIVRFRRSGRKRLFAT